MINSFFAAKLSKVNQDKINEVSTFLGIQADWLCAVIYFETAKTFSPSKTNQIGSVGLIQFTHDSSTPGFKTINGKKYSLAYIKSLDFINQMNLVQEYYKPFKGKMNNFLDVYLVTFFPLALSKSDDYILRTKTLSASLIAKQNPSFDSNKDGQITRKEIKDFFSRFYGKTVFATIDKPIIKLPLILALFFLLIMYKFKSWKN